MKMHEVKVKHFSGVFLWIIESHELLEVICSLVSLTEVSKAKKELLAFLLDLLLHSISILKNLVNSVFELEIIFLSHDIFKFL
jgi:hypothetical protein